jgi:hypothetical protein
LTADLQLYVLQQLLGGVESGARAGQHELDHDVGDQIAVAGDLSGNFVARYYPFFRKGLDFILSLKETHKH